MRLARPVTDFYVAGRLMPAMFNGMAIAASIMAALVFVGLAGAIGPTWSGVGSVVVGGSLGLIFAGLVLAPYLRGYGGFTLPDFLAERFGGELMRPPAVVGVILCSFPALAAVLLGFGMIAAWVFPITLEAGVGAGVAMIFFATLIGGMRSLSLSQIAQYAVLFLVAVVGMGVMLWQTGSPFGTTIVLLDEVIPSLGLRDFAASHNADRLALIACVAGGIASLPHLLMRSFTTPSVAEARTSFFASVLFAGLLCLAAPAAVALIEAARVGADDSLSHIAEAVLAVGGMTGLLAIGSALALAMANTLSHDLYFKSVHPAASTRRRMLVARLSVVLVAGLAALAAVGEPQLMLIGTSAAFSLAASTFLPVLVLGIWWKRATGEAALAAMIAGLVVCLYYMLAPHYIPFAFYETSSFLSNASADQAAIYETLSHDYYLVGPEAKSAVLADWDQTAREIANWWGVRGTFAGVFAVPVGFVVMIVVSLFTRAPSEDVKRFVKGLSERAA